MVQLVELENAAAAAGVSEGSAITSIPAYLPPAPLMVPLDEGMSKSAHALQEERRGVVAEWIARSDATSSVITGKQGGDDTQDGTVGDGFVDAASVRQWSASFAEQCTMRALLHQCFHRWALWPEVRTAERRCEASSASVARLVTARYETLLARSAWR